MFGVACTGWNNFIGIVAADVAAIVLHRDTATTIDYKRVAGHCAVYTKQKQLPSGFFVQTPAASTVISGATDMLRIYRSLAA